MTDDMDYLDRPSGGGMEGLDYEPPLAGESLKMVDHGSFVEMRERWQAVSIVARGAGRIAGIAGGGPQCAPRPHPAGLLATGGADEPSGRTRAMSLPGRAATRVQTQGRPRKGRASMVPESAWLDLCARVAALEDQAVMRIGPPHPNLMTLKDRVRDLEREQDITIRRMAQMQAAFDEIFGMWLRVEQEPNAGLRLKRLIEAWRAAARILGSEPR